MGNRNRFTNALVIQGGACNGRAVAKALVQAYEEAAAENSGTDATNADTAVQLILHQLCHLARMNVDDGARHPDNPAIFHYERAEQACIERCDDPATLEMLGLSKRRQHPT